jgi:hypothetical protein
MEAVKNSVEQRVVLYDVSWETYERLLLDHLDNSVPHFTYDRGVLAIVSPLPEHEKINRTISLLVELLAEEFGVDLENLGSTTFKREDLKRGFEPESSFYIQNEERVYGKADLDLDVDPPPDLSSKSTSPVLAFPGSRSTCASVSRKSGATMEKGSWFTASGKPSTSNSHRASRFRF